MNDGFAWWLIVLGIAIGVGLVYVFLVRLPRAESDVDANELPLEADWISRNIESYGGVAPQPLVEEVLELHRQYLLTGAAPLAPNWRPDTLEADGGTDHQHGDGHGHEHGNGHGHEHGHGPEQGNALDHQPLAAPTATTAPAAERNPDPS